MPLLPKTEILKLINDKNFEENPNVQQDYQKICKYLNDLKCGEGIDFETFLNEIGMVYETFIFALRSGLKFSKVFLKRTISEIRINSYNELLLKAWEANIDVQFIPDGYACAAYTVLYVSKSQRGMSNLMHEACIQARHDNMSLRQQARQIGNVEICAQEAAYLVEQNP